MQLKVGHKIMIGFLISILITAVVGVIGVTGISSLKTDIGVISDHTIPASADAYKMRIKALTALSNLQSYQITGRRNYLPDVRSQVAKLNALYRNSFRVIANPQLLPAYHTLGGPIHDITRLTQHLSTDASKSRLKATIAAFDRDIQTLVARGNTLNGIKAKAVAQRLAKYDAQAVFSRTFIQVSVPVGLILVAVSAFYIIRIISRPLKKVAVASEQIASGDLTVSLDDLPLSAGDEIGSMSRAFVQMADTLKRIVGGIQETAGNLKAMSGELSATTQQGAMAVTQVAEQLSALSQAASTQAEHIRSAFDVIQEVHSTTEQIATGAQTQADEVVSTSGSAKQMNDTISQVADLAQRVAGQAVHSLQTAQQGAKAVGDTVSEMREIETAVTETATKVRTLGEDSLKISDVIHLITSIAERTNLLALNATIEAARAGEQGRGFAVVADEVRALAERSREAGKEIAEMIGAIQTGTQEAVTAMNDTTQKVVMGASMAQQAGKALDSILEGMAETSQQMQGISQATAAILDTSGGILQSSGNLAAIAEQNSAAAAQMTASADHMNNAMGEVSSLVENSSISIHGINAAAEEVSASTEEIAVSAESLAHMAEELRNTLAWFRT